MVDLNKLRSALERRPSPQHRKLFHFTERVNIPSIKKNGLLSLRELEIGGYVDVKYSSNSGSRIADKRKGLDAYVHLCLFPEHPMQFAKSISGEVEDTVWLSIPPSVITLPGVLFCSRVSNSDGAEIIPVSEITAQSFDAEVVLKRTDWKDPVIRQRINAAKKYEILVPNKIAPELIEF